MLPGFIILFLEDLLVEYSKSYIVDWFKDHGFSDSFPTVSFVVLLIGSYYLTVKIVHYYRETRVEQPIEEPVFRHNQSFNEDILREQLRNQINVHDTIRNEQQRQNEEHINTNFVPGINGNSGLIDGLLLGSMYRGGLFGSNT